MNSNNPFFVQAADYSQGLNTLSKGLSNFKQQRDQQAQQEKQQQAIAGLADAAQSGDKDAVADYLIQNPSISQGIQDTVYNQLGVKEEGQKQRLTQDALEVLSSPQNAENILLKRIEDGKAQGADTSHSEQELALYRKNPEAYPAAVEGFLIGANPEAWKNFNTAKKEAAKMDLDERKFEFDKEYKNQTLSNTQAYRSKMLSIQQSKAKNAQPKFVKTVKDNDGNVIKLYSDGSERPLQQNEKIKDDSMRGGMTPKQADNIISAAPEFSRKNAGFASRLRDSIDGNNALIETGKVSPERAAAISKALGDGNVSNLALSPEEQQYMVNAKDALMAILRPETGAAITPDEMQEYAKIYLPQVGDSKGTIELKNKKLENQFKSLRGTAGKTYEALRVAGGYDEEQPNENNNVNETFTSSDGLQIKVIQ